MQQGIKTRSTRLAAWGMIGLAMATGVSPRAALAPATASRQVDNIDDGDVSDWKPFMGSGGNISHRTSSSRATTGSLSMKMTTRSRRVDTPASRRRFPTPANWSAASALTMSVNGLGTGHKFRVQVYDAGNERWEYSFTVSFTGWQQVTIPFGSFTRASYQVPGAQVNSVFDRGAHQGDGVDPVGPGPGSGAVVRRLAGGQRGDGCVDPTPATRASAGADAPASTPAGTIIPLYSYPTPGAWDAVIAAKKAYPKVPMMAVVNPNTGPGYAARARRT